MAQISIKPQTDGGDFDPAMAQSSTKPQMDDEDWISQLPDEILAHILSYIPRTEFAIFTAARLSKRWKLVWTSVPNLVFDVNCWTRSFERYFTRVLSLNNVRHVRNAGLYFHTSRFPNAGKWIEALVARNPEIFDLQFDTITYAPYPLLAGGSIDTISGLTRNFYIQEKLVELRLRRVVLDVPSSVYFPCLKTVKLVLVRFLGVKSIKSLLSGCPVLNELHVDQDKCGSVVGLGIYSATLQTLYICIRDGDYLYTRVVIDAPKLRYLNVYGLSASFHMIDVSLLAEAHVSISRSWPSSTFNLLTKISHVRELFLNRQIMKVFTSAGSLQSLPVFENLIKFTVELDWKESLYLLPQILHYTPNVVYIVVKLKNDLAAYRSEQNPLDLLHSILSCVESVQITEESGQYMPVVSCSLGNATALKNMSFYGLPLHFARENRYLKGLLTACEVECECASFVGQCILKTWRG